MKEVAGNLPNVSDERYHFAVDPVLTEGDTIQALHELRSWYDRYVVDETLQLSGDYREALARYSTAAGGILDIASTEGQVAETKYMLRSALHITTNRLILDPQTFRPRTLASFQVGAIKAGRIFNDYPGGVLDGAAHWPQPDWDPQIHDYLGSRDALAIYSLRMTEHDVIPTATTDAPGTISIVHHLERGHEAYAAALKPTKTHELSWIPSERTVQEQVFRDVQSSTLSKVLATTVAGDHLQEAIAQGSKRPIEPSGSNSDFMEAVAAACRPGTWDKEKLWEDARDFPRDLAALALERDAPTLKLMRPDIIRVARIAMLCPPHYRSQLTDTLNQSVFDRLEWAHYYAPLLQEAVYMRMAADDPARAEAANRAMTEVKKSAAEAETLYNRLVGRTISPDPDYWEISRP